MSLDAETCYAALTERNSEFEGVFYVGVRTTGVFCRPTRAAAQARELRVLCRCSAGDARSYRPCKRCRPLSHPNETSAVVRELVDAIEREPDKLWRTGDCEALHVHGWTTPRQFRKRFGMTFVAYARARRLGAAFKAIRAGERVISSTRAISPAAVFATRSRRSWARHPRAARRALFAACLDTLLGPGTAVRDEVGVTTIAAGWMWLLRTLFIRAEAWQVVGAIHHQLPEADRDQRPQECPHHAVRSSRDGTSRARGRVDSGRSGKPLRGEHTHGAQVARPCSQRRCCRSAEPQLGAVPGRRQAAGTLGRHRPATPRLPDDRGGHRRAPATQHRRRSSRPQQPGPAGAAGAGRAGAAIQSRKRWLEYELRCASALATG
jgi:methylphosphotriester-DNA--protein-cysteine methyltransferase